MGDIVTPREIVLDIETQNGPDDVPRGWDNPAGFKVSCAVTSPGPADEHVYRTWWEHEAVDLIDHLADHDRIIGFNIKKFDYGVLSAYGSTGHLTGKTVDILDLIYTQLNFRISLQSLAETNFGLTKLGAGSQAVAWWRSGELEQLQRYCREDVRITRLLYKKILDEGYLLYKDRRVGEVCRLRLQVPKIGD